MTVPLPNVAEALNKGGPPSVVWRAWFQAINAKFQAGDLSLSEVQTALDAIRAQLEEMGAGNVSQGEGIAVYGTLADTLTIALRALEDSGTGGALLKITRDQYGRVEGTEAATTDDLTEGATNLYHTPERVRDVVGTALVAGTNVTITVNDGADTITIDASGEGGDGNPRSAVIDPAYDMLGNALADPWVQNFSSSFATTTSINGGATAPGVWRLGTETGSTTRSCITVGATPNISTGAGTVVIPFRFRLPTLSDATNTYAVSIGLADDYFSATDRIVINYSRNNNGGALRLVCTAAGVTTIVSGGGSPVAANSWVVGRIEINAAGSEVNLYEGGTLTATVTTNIPTAPMLLGAIIAKSAGGSIRYLDIDYLGPPQITFSSPR